MGSKSRPAVIAAGGGRAGRVVTGSVTTPPATTATASPARTAAKKTTATRAAPQKTAAAKKAAADKAAAKTATASGSARKKAVTVTAPAKKTTGATKTGSGKTKTSAAPAKPPAAAPGRAPRKTAASATAGRTGAAGTTGRTARPRKTTEEVRRLAEQLAVADDESPWTPEELKQVQADLLAEREVHVHEIDEAEAELEDLLRGPGDGAGDDQADAGAKTFEREHEIALANNARDMLRQVERALEQLVAGTYGVCENCGRPIGKLRLQAYPRATLCMPCKKNQERH
ncbi:MAG TPA: TraR/DksA C4-type zinc finger protein [Intrasporangium sp.]|uniref:TraR/DksA family transcriptional regulator n=1 Tax=Intrasporangium sp. TaxID=1925024 RepID=UPI002D798950|nr:TraR/DksA C4-type zinc finger protein [Intrasporangium sp.]HET7398517.1 TraR/DksA C4-type zinc finger protein [Intrasporangium sp.]